MKKNKNLSNRVEWADYCLKNADFVSKEKM